MSWVTPITDRAQTDIDSKTSKGYFNVSDWVRIDGNVDVVLAMLTSNGYETPSKTSLTTPTTTTIPTVSELNSFINNIVILQEVVYLGSSLATLKHDYQPGANADAPDFNDVNDWENNLLVMYDSIPKAVDFRIACGVARAGQERFWQNQFR